MGSHSETGLCHPACKARQSAVLKLLCTSPIALIRFLSMLLVFCEAGPSTTTYLMLRQFQGQVSLGKLERSVLFASFVLQIISKHIKHGFCANFNFLLPVAGTIRPYFWTFNWKKKTEFRFSGIS